MKMDYETAKEFFRYDPETGKIFCIKRYCRKQRVGDEVGAQTLNYVVVGFRYKRFPAQCLAWLLMTGQWPAKDIDHFNHNTHDNKWTNLRLATKQQNAANVPARITNTSGVKGVSWHKMRQKWRACITVMGKQKHLGLFETKELAKIAHDAEAKNQFGSYAFTAPGA